MNEYVLKLISASGEIVKTMHSKYDFTDIDIENILKEHKNQAMYCEKSKQVRLHTKTLYNE